MFFPLKSPSKGEAACKKCLKFGLSSHERRENILVSHHKEITTRRLHTNTHYTITSHYTYAHITFHLARIHTHIRTNTNTPSENNWTAKEKFKLKSRTGKLMQVATKRSKGSLGFSCNKPRKAGGQIDSHYLQEHQQLDTHRRKTSFFFSFSFF